MFQQTTTRSWGMEKECMEGVPSVAGQVRRDWVNSVPAASQMAFTAFADPSFVAKVLPVKMPLSQPHNGDIHEL